MGRLLGFWRVFGGGADSFLTKYSQRTAFFGEKTSSDSQRTASAGERTWGISLRTASARERTWGISLRTASARERTWEISLRTTPAGEGTGEISLSLARLGEGTGKNSLRRTALGETTTGFGQGTEPASQRAARGQYCPPQGPKYTNRKKSRSGHPRRMRLRTGMSARRPAWALRTGTVRGPGAEKSR